MNKTDEKSMTIDEMIQQLQSLRKELGGEAEVTIANAEESCFDGVGKLFSIHIASTGLKAVGIIRGNVVLKP